MKTWNDIFFASVRRGDDPCYAIFLADEYVKRKAEGKHKRGRPKKNRPVEATEKPVDALRVEE